MSDFPILFSPIKLGPLEIKNRIGGSCTTTGGADENGYIREECIYSYAGRSEGGAGFITIECTFATDWGAKTTSFGNPRISGRTYYEGQSNLAEGIKQCGAKAFIQITPSFGRQGSSKTSGEVPGPPSPLLESAAMTPSSSTARTATSFTSSSHRAPTSAPTNTGARWRTASAS